MGQRTMDKPPTKAKPSAEPEDAPEQLDADVRRDVLRAAETCRERFEASPSHHAYQLREILEALGRYPHLIDAVHRFMGSNDCPPKLPGVARVMAIGGVPVRRWVETKDPKTGKLVPVVDKDGAPVSQKIRKGRQWEGPSMVRKTRWAIAAYDADPLDVAASVIRDLPPPLKADCRKYGETNPERVGLAIKRLLGDGNLRSALIANRGDSGAANVDYKTLVANPEIVANIERADQANFDLLGHDDWEQIPAKVFRAILEALGHPKPGNLTRG
jgi:hypothetical protein